MAKDINQINDSWQNILKIMETLRLKCPWDQKQTIHSLNHLTLEEVHELSEAIRDEDWDEMKVELGDVLLHLIFYAHIADEQGRFDITDVIDSLAEKLIRRHPHIYGNVQVADESEVKSNWEKIKLNERKDKKVLDGVPSSLPSLIKALRMQEKVATVGFDWPDIHDVLEKVDEELREIEEASTAKEKEEEFGDLLFTLVNYARKSGINPENALQIANKKFKSRFDMLEDIAHKNDQKLTELSLDEMENIWQHVKSK